VTAAAVLLVALGAAVGAPARFVVERRLTTSWPLGTWVVNVVGSAVLGALIGAVGVDAARDPAASAAWVVALVGTGFCGALTTFGGFAAQVWDLLAAPREVALSTRTVRALGYGAISVLVCVGVAATAYAAVGAIAGR
jgi:CrcB protein